ncbi:MAG: RNA polymerase sigma factor [Deltaproteobacteria bacterium]|nr:RNA polymerase sigma factor [Deltaproteobacteria bacterium]
MKSTNQSGNNTAGRKAAKGKTVQVGVLERLGLAAGKRTKAESVSQLVARCQEGDRPAFRLLVERHVGGVYRHLSLLVGPGPDIDDLTQLVFLNIFQSIRRFRGQSAFSTWLFRITINVARQEIRVRTRRRRLGTAMGDANKMSLTSCEQTPERCLATREGIYAVLDQIAPKKRETYVLYMYEGYSLEEIAELLGSSVSTIGSRLQAARKEIVEVLKRKGS